MNILRLGFRFRALAQRALVAFIDRRVPNRLKLVALTAAILVISPLNILGDIPLLGIVDDGALLGVVLVWFTRASRPYRNTIDAGNLVG